MRHKSLWKISVRTTPEAEDAVAELLNSVLGLPASAYTKSDTGVSTVTVYLSQQLDSRRSARQAISVGLKRIKSFGLNPGSGKIVLAKVRREDWAESWKRHFEPIEIGGALLIKPSWSKYKARKSQAVIVLDPGLSFGTGQHPTTAFCLHQIALAARDHGTRRSPSAATVKSFLDLGTGSGILAMAAAKLGYSPVHAIDFDPESVRAAKANARANGVLPKVKIRRSDVSRLPIRPRHRGHRFDLVCANLTSDLLVARRRRIAAQLNGTGTLVLAGVLRREFAAVQKAYKALGLSLLSFRQEKEWCSGSFRFDG